MPPVFPGEKDLRQAGFFGDRLAKRSRQLAGWARRLDTDCYRLYDVDIPEVPLAVDRYGNSLLMALYERPYPKDPAEEEAWLGLMRATAAERLCLREENIRVRLRSRQRGKDQYGVLSDSGREFLVREQGLNFLVNLDQRLDTGLFLDHRPLRAMVRNLSAGKRILNLFCYTAAFSVYAAAGGAARVCSVDLSRTYLDWGIRNFIANGLDPRPHAFIQADALEWMEEAAAKGPAYDIIVLDPPTFSNSKRMRCEMDIQRDHPRIIRAALALLAPDGLLFFSTNARRFKLDIDALTGASAKDISLASIPEDFRDKRIHKAWEISRA